jgi:hypothetical protein
MNESMAAIDFYSPIDVDALPDDPMVLKQLLLELLKLLKTETKRREQVERNMDLLIRRLSQSRGHTPAEGQQVLFEINGDAEPTPAGPLQAKNANDSSTKTRKHTPHGRRRPPKDAEEREVIHDLTPDAKQQLGGENNLLPLPDVITYQFEYVAARFIVVKHVQKKYLRRDLTGAGATGFTNGEPSQCDVAGVEEIASEPASSPILQDAVAITNEVPVPPRHHEQLGVEFVDVAIDPSVLSSSKIVLAPKPPQALPGCEAAPGLLAYIWLSKYGDHLPLYRLERITQRYGIRFPRSTTCDWMMNLASALDDLMNVAIDEVLQSKVLNTDDTSVRMQDSDTGQIRIARFWNYLGDEEHPLTVFDFTLSRERDGPATFLKNYEGYLQADAYSVYDGIYLKSRGSIVEVACWQHARAKYKEAVASDPTLASMAIAHIKCLYTVEEKIRELCQGEWNGLSLDERALRIQSLRQEESVPVLDGFKKWLDATVGKVLPKSPLAEALRYTLNQWEALRVYTTCGRLAIDNNSSERAHRGIAIGRKNWLFVGSERGGHAAAVHFTFIASCVRNKVDPFAWLVDVLERLPTTKKEDLRELLPHRWKPAPKS